MLALSSSSPKRLHAGAPLDAEVRSGLDHGTKRSMDIRGATLLLEYESEDCISNADGIIAPESDRMLVHVVSEPEMPASFR